MNRLRDRYLNIHLNDVPHPESESATQTPQHQQMVDDPQLIDIIRQWSLLHNENKLELSNLISNYVQERS